MKTTQCSSCRLEVDISSVTPGSGATCPACGLTLLMAEPPPVLVTPAGHRKSATDQTPPRIPEFIGLTQLFLAVGIPFAAVIDNMGTARFPILAMTLFGALIATIGVQMTNGVLRVLREIRRQSPGPR